MKETIHFDLWGPGWPVAPHIDDPVRYQELLNFAVELQLTKGGAIRCAPDHPGLPPLLEKLREMGWTGVHGYVPAEKQATHFSIRAIVSYDEAALDALPFLYLSDCWGEWPITATAGRDGKRSVGIADENVGSDTGQGWDQSHGDVDGSHSYFVHPKVRAYFEQVGLDLIYHPLEWDHPELAEGEFWEIDTPHTMPPCLNKKVTWDDGYRTFEDEGREPVTLHFQRAAVEAMGSFDAAWTQEEIGKPGDPRDGGHYLIVSQRFRRACLDYGLDPQHLGFQPVQLVG